MPDCLTRLKKNKKSCLNTHVMHLKDLRNIILLKLANHGSLMYMMLNLIYILLFEPLQLSAILK